MTFLRGCGGSFGGLLAALSWFGAVGCMSDGEAVLADGQELQEELVRTEVRGAVYGGLGTEKEAKQSWQKACDAWFEGVVRSAPVDRLVERTCGEPKDVGGAAGHRFTSEPVATLAVSVPAGAKLLVQQVGVVTGDYGERANAIESWRKACDTAVARQQELFGARVVAVACGVPTDAATSWGSRLESALWVWALPVAEDGSFELFGYAEGPGGRPDTALRGWRGACDAWLDRTRALVGDATLVTYACGQPSDVGGASGYRFASKTRVVFAPTAGGASPRCAPAGVARGATGDVNTSLSSWQNRCTEMLIDARSRFGEAFAGGSCPPPADVGEGFEYAFESPAVVCLADGAAADGPAGAE